MRYKNHQTKTIKLLFLAMSAQPPALSLKPLPLVSADFNNFGDVISVDEARQSLGEPLMINQGNCERFTNIAGLDIADSAVGISLFNAKPCDMPLRIDYLERHPLGSQAFIPMNCHPFLVIVADDMNGVPDSPKAFITDGMQGVNIRRNTWHGVLTVLHPYGGLFAVVDYVGEQPNLQEHPLTQPLTVVVDTPRVVDT